jgi:hypothetical protein
VAHAIAGADRNGNYHEQARAALTAAYPLLLADLRRYVIWCEISNAKSEDEITRLRSDLDNTCRQLQEAQEEADALRAQVEAVEDPTFEEMVERLTWWLDEHYPADIFTGVSGNPGPVFVVAVRAAIAALGEEEGKPE